jgi:hypothetical protein
MGLRRHTDAFPRLDEVQDHPGAGVGLARAGRALDRECRPVQEDAEATPGLERRLPVPR